MLPQLAFVSYLSAVACCGAEQVFQPQALYWDASQRVSRDIDWLIAPTPMHCGGAATLSHLHALTFYHCRQFRGRLSSRITVLQNGFYACASAPAKTGSYPRNDSMCVHDGRLAIDHRWLQQHDSPVHDRLGRRTYKHRQLPRTECCCLCHQRSFCCWLRGRHGQPLLSRERQL